MWAITHLVVAAVAYPSFRTCCKRDRTFPTVGTRAPSPRQPRTWCLQDKTVVEQAEEAFQQQVDKLGDGPQEPVRKEEADLQSW